MLYFWLLGHNLLNNQEQQFYLLLRSLLVMPLLMSSFPWAHLTSYLSVRSVLFLNISHHPIHFPKSSSSRLRQSRTENLPPYFSLAQPIFCFPYPVNTAIQGLKAHIFPAPCPVPSQWLCLFSLTSVSSFLIQSLTSVDCCCSPSSYWSISVTLLAIDL